MPLRGVAVLLARGAVAGAQPGQVEPGVALQKLDEMLAHHAGGAEDANFDFRLHMIVSADLPDHPSILIEFPTASSSCRLGTRSSSVCATWMVPGPIRNGCAPGAAERRDVGGEGHHGGFDAVERAEAHGGNFEHLAQPPPCPATAACDGVLGGGRIAHQADEDLGAGFVGDHVGRAAAGRWCRCSACSARADRRPAAGRRGCGPARRAACRWPNRPAPDRRSAPSSGGRDFVAQRALGAERQLVPGGLAVDEIARAARAAPPRDRRPRCCALRRPRTAAPKLRTPPSSSASAALIMAAMMPLVSQAPRPQMNSSSSREGKNGGTVSMWVESVTVGRSPQREDVEAARLDFDTLGVAADSARRGPRGSPATEGRHAPRCR